MKGIVIGFKLIGENEINIPLLVKKWNNLFWVAQWKDEYRLIKYKRKNSAAVDIKTNISKSQAIEIINKLNLHPFSGGFTSAINWKQIDAN